MIQKIKEIIINSILLIFGDKLINNRDKLQKEHDELINNRDKLRKKHDELINKYGYLPENLKKGAHDE